MTKVDVVDVERTRVGSGRNELELEGGGSGDKHREFPIPSSKQREGEKGRLTRLNLVSRQAGQIDTLMRFTDEGEGGGDNSFVPLAGLCQAKCTRTRKVRPKQICTPNHSQRRNRQLKRIAKCFRLAQSSINPRLRIFAEPS